jgi:hypothetical protein
MKNKRTRFRRVPYERPRVASLVFGGFGSLRPTSPCQYWVAPFLRFQIASSRLR